MTSVTTTPPIQIAARPPRPRAYAVPIVRPVPRRPTGMGADDTW
jgi:hypothetical protein